MKRIFKFLNDYFTAPNYSNLDLDALMQAMDDKQIRTYWLALCMEEIKNINLEVERRLLMKTTDGLVDLCARRKAYQDVLEALFIARRQVAQGIRHNPRLEQIVNLDRVTV